jgi:hypothetical protein
VNQRRASRHRVPPGAVSRAQLTAAPRGSQVFAMAAPMVAPMPEASVSAVPAVTVEPMAVRMAALTVEPMAVRMAALTEGLMAALTVAPTEGLMAGPTVAQMAEQTVGRGDA